MPSGGPGGEQEAVPLATRIALKNAYAGPRFICLRTKMGDIMTEDDPIPTRTQLWLLFLVAKVADWIDLLRHRSRPIYSSPVSLPGATDAPESATSRKTG